MKVLPVRALSCHFAVTSFAIAIVAWNRQSPSAAAETQYWYTPLATKRIAAELVDLVGAEVSLRLQGGETVCIEESRFHGANRLYLHAYRLAEEGQAHLRVSPYTKGERKLASLVDGFVDIRGIQYRVRSLELTPDGDGARKIIVDNGFPNGRRYAITPEEVDQIHVLPYTWRRPGTRLGASPPTGAPFQRRGPQVVPRWPAKNRWKYELVFSNEFGAWTDVETQKAHIYFVQSRTYLHQFRRAERFASATWHIHQGRRHVAAQQFDVGVRFFNAAIELEPDFADGHLERGIVYRLLGDYTRSAVDLDQAVHLARQYEAVAGARESLLRALYNRCAVRSLQGSHDEAVADAKWVVELTEGRSGTAAQQLLAKASSRAATQTAAIAQRLLDLFRQGGTLTSDEISQAMRQAERAVDFGRTAVEACRAGRLDLPRNTRVYARLHVSCARLPSDNALRNAKAAFARQEYRQAIELAALAVDKNPDSNYKLYADEYHRLLKTGAERLLAASRQAREENRHDDSVRSARDAYEVCAGESTVTGARDSREVTADLLMRARQALADSLFTRAVGVHFKNGRFEEAIADLNMIASLGADDRETHEYLGRSHMFLRDYAAAQDHFSKVIASTGESVVARYLRGWCFIQVGDFGSAKKDFSHLIGLNPAESEFWEGRAWANRGSGEHEAALQDISRAIELDSGKLDYLLFRAHYQLARDELDRADADVGNVLRGSPDNGEAIALRTAISTRRLALAEERRRADPYFMDTDAARDVLPNLLRVVAGIGLEEFGRDMHDPNAGALDLGNFAAALIGHAGKRVREKAIVDGVDKVWPNLPREARFALIQVISKVTEGRLSFQDLAQDALEAAMIGLLNENSSNAVQITGVGTFLADLYRGMNGG